MNITAVKTDKDRTIIRIEKGMDGNTACGLSSEEILLAIKQAGFKSWRGSCFIGECADINKGKSTHWINVNHDPTPDDPCIVLEESDESAFWLQFIMDENLAERRRVEPLLKEAEGLTAIFFSSRKTARANR